MFIVQKRVVVGGTEYLPGTQVIADHAPKIIGDDMRLRMSEESMLQLRREGAIQWVDSSQK